jgi:hypothetical protein
MVRVAQTAGRQAELDKLLADKQSWTNFWQTSRVEQTARRQLELKKSAGRGKELDKLLEEK